MFGLIAAGRLVQTDFQAVSETQFLVNVPEAEKVNHVVVFLTGQTPFPETMGAAVYFSVPSAAGSSWQLLGHITNAKPSAIFKISNLKSASSLSAPSQFGLFASAVPPQGSVIQIGVSVEPLSALAQQTPAANTTATTGQTFAEFSQKMLESFYNYASSFAVTQAQMTPNPGESYIPASCIQTWYENFQRKLQHNPGFWKS